MSHGRVGWNEEGTFRHLAEDLGMDRQDPELVGSGVDIPLDPRLVSAAENSSPRTFVHALTLPREDVEMLATTPDDLPTAPTAGPAGPTELLQKHANNDLQESD